MYAGLGLGKWMALWGFSTNRECVSGNLASELHLVEDKSSCVMHYMCCTVVRGVFYVNVDV
jgi:hypothetical protein